jgi:hypothetical protein
MFVAGLSLSSGDSLTLTPAIRGLHSPVYLTAPKGDPRIFVVEQDGLIRLVKNGQIVLVPFLDLTHRVSSGGERGLLSMAFHPAYARNGLFFVNYTDHNGDTRVERYHVSANPDVADTAGHLIITIRQPYANHNGGLVLFGPDGMLYVGMGDGGSGGDPHGNGQNPNALLASLLRLDVDHGDPYAVPPDNPFARGGGGREVWAKGLRNPWRFAFGPDSMLYIADVGQNAWEEVDVAPANAAGRNYGWNSMEGSHCYHGLFCRDARFTPPVLEYDHGNGCSVIGGFVYRGTKAPGLKGHYVYSDYCSGWIRSFRYSHGVAVDQKTWKVPELGPVLSFGEDGAGELYVLTAGGVAWRFDGAK